MEVQRTAAGQEIFRRRYYPVMARLRSVLGLIAAAILFLSAGAHSFLGWKSLQPRIEAFGAPADLVTGLRIGWQFGGAAMLVFGVIAAWVFIQRLRGTSVPAFPVVVMGVVYALYGAWAMSVTGDGFFAIFIIPGVLLLAASWPWR
jgi:hypothetical protein